MKNPMVRMRELYNTMNESDRVIAGFFLEEPEAVLEMNIRELSAKLYLSTASIVRFCKHLGFDGYRDFKQNLVYELAMYAKDVQRVNLDVTREDSLDAIVEKTTMRNVMSLNETEKLVDPATLKSCVDLIDQAQNILFFGIGASGICAKDAYMKFLRLNKPCQLTDDSHVQITLAKNSTRKDVGIVFSYSGETTEMVECARIMRENQTPVIVITRFGPSTISKTATHVLFVSASEPLFNISACASRISQLSMIDILYTAYVVRHYDESLSSLIRTHMNKPHMNIHDLLQNKN